MTQPGNTALVDNAHTHAAWYMRHGRGFPARVSLCATSPDDWRQVADIAAAHPSRVIPSFGIHPWHMNGNSGSLLDQLPELLRQYPDAGIGETGLDKTSRAAQPLHLQKDLLLRHLHIAQEYNRPISLHCVRAWGSLAEILTEAKPNGVLLHGWDAPPDMIAPFAKLGCYFSLGCRSLRSERTLSGINNLPLDRLLLETDDSDSPLLDGLGILAERTGIPPRELGGILHGNFNRLFPVNTGS